MILKINNAVCEMPMLEIKNNWTATSFKCQGKPYSAKKFESYIIKKLGNSQPITKKQIASYGMQGKTNTDNLNLYPLDKFNINLKNNEGKNHLKAVVSLELDNRKLNLELDNKLPVIRDRIIRLLSSKTLKDINSKKGKQEASDEIMDTINAMILDGQVKAIYFSEFTVR